MRRTQAGSAITFFVVALCFAPLALAASPDMWLHVKVESTKDDGEIVRVNVPLSLAEKVIPLVNADNIRAGKIKIGEIHNADIDLPGILAAVRDTKDGEFVTVQSKSENVRVAKEKGDLLITVRDDGHGKNERVDIRIPMSIVDSLVAGKKDELDLVAMLKALQSHGDMKLVSVVDGDETVGIWIDSKSTIE